MNEKTTVGILVGRFQVPELHEAHQKLIEQVCKNHPKVIIFLGVSPALCTRKNPLDFEARKQMILEKYPDINVLYIKDIVSDDAWSKNLDSQICDLVSPNQIPILYGSRDSFIPHYKGVFETKELESNSYVSGTEARINASARAKSYSEFRSGVIWAVYNQYPKVFTTVDIAILDDIKNPSKILLARKPNEFKYRFVGGFAEPSSQSFEDDAKREVSEETGLEVSEMKYVCSMFIDDWRYRNEVDKIKTVFFKCQYIFGRPEAQDDICELKWFDLTKLADNDIVPPHLGLFHKLKDELK